MFLVECSNASSPLKLLSNDAFDCCNEEDRHGYVSVQLFKHEYHKGSTLQHLNDLFSFARKYFHFLNQAARNNNLSTESSEYSNYSILRECIVDFFLHIKNILDYNYDDSVPISAIKKSLISFRLMMKTIDTLPDFIIQNCVSDNGNQCPLASFHIFHIYLELLWLQFTILLSINSHSESAIETLFETETEAIHPEDVLNSGYNPDIEKEIEWLLYNLVSLANKSYNKAGSSKIFACNCVKDIWHAIQIRIEKLSQENKCSNFWSYFNNIVLKFILSSNAMNNSSDPLYRMETIKSDKPFEFPLHLLLKISQLQQSNDLFSSTIVSNFPLLESILKHITTSENSIPELILRNIMIRISKILNMWTETKNEIITLLWEYFHKRLNSGFLIPGGEDKSVSLQNSSVSDIVCDLKSRISLDHNRNMKIESSYSIFVTLLGLHLKKAMLQKQTALCQKIKGRIFPKFTSNKLQALNEYGIQNFSMLFLVMAITTDTSEMCNKLQELILQLPFDNLQLNKKQIIIKTHLVILNLFTDSGISISKAALPLKSITMKYCNLRDSESMSLIKIALNGSLDIINDSAEFQNDEYILIDIWMSKYLNFCNLSDIYNPLESFMSILSKLQIFCSYNMNCNDSLRLMVDALFKHIFTCIKSLHSNGTSALQIADLAYGFCKFVQDNQSEKYESFENIIRFFINVENANERVIRHFLIQLLQDDQILRSIEEENKQCQSLLIRCWIKCALLSSESASDDETHLMLLICQLGEFSSLNIRPCHGSAEQRSVCNFFYSIRIAWDAIEDINEKFDFKKRVNQYIAEMDKYISKVLKTPSTQEYVIQLYVTMGTLFLHCSPIIYSRGNPTCVLHTFISTIILPPQLFMEKKLHQYCIIGICKSWYMFMKGLYQLEYKSDAYIEKAMKDMVIQYLPFFAEKTLSTKDNAFNVPYRMIPNDCSEDLKMEEFILEKISINFITCRGKQSHIHSTKALSVIQQLCSTTNINLLHTIISSTLLSIFEQFMFSEQNNPNKRISIAIITSICNNYDTRIAVKDVLVKTCQKHLAFSSLTFFKLVIHITPIIGTKYIKDFMPTLISEVSRVEKMRGVGYDQGLRNGINDIETAISNM